VATSSFSLSIETADLVAAVAKMDSGQDSKAKKLKTHHSNAPLALAFDHCSSVLFSFLTDVEAANVACALCMPKFLATKLYEIKRELPLMAVVAGQYACVVRNVLFHGRYDDSCFLSRLPPTVTSMSVVDHSSMSLSPSALPRSLTRLSCTKNYDEEDRELSDFLRLADPEDWPPRLTSVRLEYDGYNPNEMPFPPLPSTLSDLFFRAHHFLREELPSSLTALRAATIDQPFSQLPRTLTALTIEEMHGERIAELEHLPPSLTFLSVNANDTFKPIQVTLPASLRVLHLTGLAAMQPCLPERLEVLTINNVYQEPSWSFDFPLRLAALTKLELLGCQFDQPIRAADLPRLQLLLVDEHFTQPLDDLPLSLTGLTLHVCDYYGHDQNKNTLLYDHPLDRLPSSLTRLQLERDYDHPLDQLPSSLRCLVIEGSFNRPLDHLPRSLTELALKGPDFNQPLDHLPHALVELALLSDSFNQPLDHLPDSLTDMYLSGCFNQPLAHLPASLTKLTLSASAFNQPLDRLPQHLQILDFSSDAFDHPLDTLPSGLTRLTLQSLPKFHKPLDHLPAMLRELLMPDDYNQPLNRLPSKLTVLTFSFLSDFNRPLNHLPHSLSTLHLGGKFDHPFVRLPRGLTELCVHTALGKFDQSLPLVKPEASSESKSKPEGSEKDECKNMNDIDDVTYPTALRSSTLGPSFNQPLSLPPSLTKLDMPGYGAFVKSLPIASLPVNLTYLSLPRRYARRFPRLVDIAAVRQRCPFVAIPRKGSNENDDDDDDDDSDDEEDEEDER